MNDQLPTGTTLEILAPYLPYGIEVEVVPLAKRGMLVGLNQDKKHPARIAHDIVGAGILNHFKMGVANLLPVLRPFSQLCDPLPDGTVPAVEVAKLVPYAHKFNWDEVGATLKRCGNIEFIEVTSPSTHILTMYNGDYGFEETYFNVALKVAEYLRRHHFAVGLEPHQYIAAAATPTTEEETR